MKDNVFINILCNVLIPIAILDKLPRYWHHPQVHLYSVLIAFSIPLVYGGVDYFQKRKFNFIALLGLLNILFTGGFVIINVNSTWYSYKEALFPLLVGLFVLASSWTKKPFIRTLFLNPQVLHLDKIDEHLQKNNNTEAFNKHLMSSNIFLSFSFFLSSFLNYTIAKTVFVPITQSLNEFEQKQVLNEQIASMTAKSFLGIMLPSMITLMLIFWYFFSGTKKLTQLQTDEILKG